MTDYLQLIATKTRECPVTLKSDNRDDPASQHGDLCDCKGSGRVLDPRFDGLRWDYMSVESYDDEEIEEGYFKHGDRIYCTHRDLAVLQGVLQELYWGDGDGLEMTLLIGIKVRAQIGPDWHGMPWFEANTPLEAAAHAVWNWLEAQEKVKA